MPEHYRGRADAATRFAEPKNQWDWNGCTSRKPAPCQLMANLVVLIHYWWNLY